MGKFFDALQKAASKDQENKRVMPRADTDSPIEAESKPATSEEQTAPPREEEHRLTATQEQPAPAIEQVSKPATTEEQTAAPLEQENRLAETLEQPAPSLKQVPAVDPETIDSLRLEPPPEDACAAEQFKMLRSHLLFPPDRSNPRTIMVTSAIPGEGKSIVAGNLAVSIALGKQEHVLLMECDLRRPSLCNTFGLDNCRGLSDYLLEEAELSDLLCKTSVDKLTLLPGGTMTTTPYELLSSQRMIALLEEVKHRYEDRFIILDSTPAQVAAETGVLSKFVDGIVMVVRYGKTSRKVVQETMERIGQDKFLGVVFNCSEGRFLNEYYYKYYGGDRKKNSRRPKRNSNR
jgi:exopolysaccharide/PEP-CTERM locus tyrosine autokinase